MDQREFLEILHRAEKLKCNTRHSDTSGGRRESVAEHSWRLALMAMLLMSEMPEIDMQKVMRMCLIHDLGEAFTGDIPAFDKKTEDGDAEEQILENWVSGFSSPQREEWLELLREMDALETPEAKVYKALDKMEAVIQHNEADISSWLPLEYDLQLAYGKDNVKCHPWLMELKNTVDEVTREKIKNERPKATAGDVPAAEATAEDAEGKKATAGDAPAAEDAEESLPEVICIGSAVVDITAKPVNEGNWRQKQQIEMVHLGPGGDSVNQSIRLAEEHVRPAVCTRLGHDENAEFLKNTLRNKGVDISLIAAHDDPSTGTAVVLVSDEGERHIFSVRGSHSALCKEDAAPVMTHIRSNRNLKAISLASVFSFPELEDDGLLEILQAAKEKNILVFADLASEKRNQGLNGVRRFLPYIDYFMPSDYDACKMAGTAADGGAIEDAAVEAAADVFLGCGAAHVVIKCGAKGSFLKDAEKSVWIPAEKVKPINTTGAGDSMNAFFISRILKGEDAETAARYACHEASMYVGGFR